MYMKIKIIITILLTTSLNQLIAQSTFEKGLAFYNKRAENRVGLIAPKENINNALSYFKATFNTSDEKKGTTYYLKSIYFKSTYCYKEGDKNRKEILDKGKKIVKAKIIS